MGRRKKEEGELYVSMVLRMDRWLDSRLRILHEIDKRVIGNKKLQYSTWLRGLLYNYTEGRKLEVEGFDRVYSELMNNNGKVE